ncbi:MAG: helix-turn-helix transcriptional regulator [Clostridia bacterium]|nr:helix-turn-helix transcriptional regulator [Clostridia bacterium]
MDIFFSDSGGEYLKYYENDTRHNYSYAINTFDYPTVHGHADYWEFCIVTEGAVRNCPVGRPDELCRKRDVCISTTQDRHALQKASKQLRYINITVRESHLLRLLNAISEDFYSRISEGSRVFQISGVLQAQIEALLHRCNLLNDEQVDQKNGLLCSAVLLLLQELNRIHQNVREHLSPFMEKLRTVTEKREFIAYSVADLGRELNYSPAHLGRLFKEHFALTPYEYLQDCKLRYACNLLQNTDMSTQAIATALGYSNASHFFSNFKKHYGLTPGQYRAQK